MDVLFLRQAVYNIIELASDV